MTVRELLIALLDNPLDNQVVIVRGCNKDYEGTDDKYDNDIVEVHNPGGDWTLIIIDDEVK